MLLAEVVDVDALEGMVAVGWVDVRRHPTLPLRMYTYSRQTGYEKRWNPVTSMCRGLVVDDEDKVVARPLPKFHNADVHERGDFDWAGPLPVGEPFEIYDKLDGSLAVVFFYGGHWHAATKGSFISDQAQWAQRWLDARNLWALDPNATYCAEIIYPGNRIVVNYGDEETLSFLAAFYVDGSEVDFTHGQYDWVKIGGTTVRRFSSSLPVADIMAALADSRDLDGHAALGVDLEGYVIRFASGLRVKAKLSHYKILHRAVTGTTPRDIWTHHGVDLLVSDPADLRHIKHVAMTLLAPIEEVRALARAATSAVATLLEQTPDEFDQWVRRHIVDIDAQLDAMGGVVEAEYAIRGDMIGDRKAFFLSIPADRLWLRNALMLRYDDRPILPALYREVQPPPGMSAFRIDEDA